MTKYNIKFCDGDKVCHDIDILAKDEVHALAAAETQLKCDCEWCTHENYHIAIGLAPLPTKKR